MKAKILFFLLSVSTLVYSQYGFRPIRDSLETCSYYNHTYEYSESASKRRQILEVYYIVENMPKPMISISEIENMLERDIRFNSHELTYNDTIYFQCVINCKGKVGDFQMIHCPAGFVNIGPQLFYIFRQKINNWEPGKQRNKNVDVLIKVRVTINKGNFNVVAPS